MTLFPTPLRPPAASASAPEPVAPTMKGDSPMKRRTFLKNSSLGLSAALVAGAASGGLMKADDGRRRVYGVPDSVRPRPPLAHDLLRLSLGRTDLPPEAWQ